MFSHRENLYLGALMLVTLSEVFSQTFNFGSISYTPYDSNANCLLDADGINLDGNWTVEGTLVAASSLWTNWKKKAYIYKKATEPREVCYIDLSSCPPSSLPTSIDACYCSGITGDTYSLSVRRRARSEESGIFIDARMLPLSFTSTDTFTEGIGLVPTIKETVSVDFNLKVDDTNMTVDSIVNPIPVSDGTTTTLTLCAPNLDSPYTLTITIDSQPTTQTDGCARTNRKFDFTSTQTQDITVAYSEASGCQRSGSYVVRFQKTSTDSSSGLSGGEIGGIVGGVLVVVGAILAILAFTYKKKRNKKKRNDNSAASNSFL